MFRLIHSLKQSDEQYLNVSANISPGSSTTYGLSVSGFNGEAIISGYVRNSYNERLAPITLTEEYSTATARGWLSESSAALHLTVAEQNRLLLESPQTTFSVIFGPGGNRNFIRTKSAYTGGAGAAEWVQWHANFPLAMGVANNQLRGRDNRIIMANSVIPANSEWHKKTNNTTRILGYPVVTRQPSTNLPLDYTNLPERFVGFTRYHRSLPNSFSHYANIKSKEEDSLQSWLTYRGFTSTILRNNQPTRSNTCILWNKNDVNIIASPPVGTLGPI
jgi:hypothetical protein